ncbi:RrF2 family transcriptional regulator [Eoetvoesiella caeni]|uniref:BadM/Rrf2 family transcriptional regulator n=1 Tax=Eoetvoesiella caeni TaxID=645616 RepID=A0A366HD61_9BURK|nr:Rrf2 family transcriptional regulator [Eoetvoesiella caeni]MCI2809171.1 Rrf2 family transcriptional regulator [Eoetvoesiella caeni]NYT54313.1 Rrf2 family transcriptional regulator [Eoetvoesiella caeni]RBP39502.1 BadM/Rrf2 family transcriptional regulator [Eoetvoesiella caeni]
MRLTTLTDYALRLLMHVAQHPERLCTIAEVAQTYDISQPHLMKITHLLGQRGWLETTRGKNGGIRLAMAPEQINLGAVVRDTEHDFELVECFAEGNSCTLSGQCGLTAIFNGALQDFLRHLDNYTLADVLPGGRNSGPGLKEHPIALMRSAARHIER